MIGKSNIGGENLNTQLTAQETLIQTITESLVGKATLANATADKILEGFCAYVGQQLVQGTLKLPEKFADLKELLGLTKIAVDKFTNATAGGSMSTLNHSLGEIPKCFMLFADTDTFGFDTAAGSYTMYCLALFGGVSSGGSFRSGLSYVTKDCPVSSHNPMAGSYSLKQGTVTASAFNMSGGLYCYAGCEYTLITLA